MSAALLLVAAGTLACQPVGSMRPPASPATSQAVAPATPGSRSYAFTNGHWFTGRNFTEKTFYSVDGILQEARPARVDSLVDLHGGFVVPPLGDAHTHNLDGPVRLAAVRDAYLREGTFYVQVLTNTRSRADVVRGEFNRPCTLDVLYANGGLTSTLSHPFLAYEPRAMGLNNPADWAARAAEIRRSRLREDDAYWFIDTQANLAIKWPKILAGHPDLIKVFLLDASAAAPAPPDSGWAQGHGLRPDVLAAVVHRARAAGLRVAAHVETADDFALALRAGVDILAHLPGYEMPAGADARRFEVTEEAARLAAERRVVITPTVSLAAVVEGSADSLALVKSRLQLQRRNLQLLIRHGARIVIGSDWFGQTAHRELEALRDLGLWDNRGLLKLGAEATPQAIFPNRRIGRLAPGYEASFVVLAANPLERFEALSQITLRVKQGCLMQTAAAG